MLSFVRLGMNPNNGNTLFFLGSDEKVHCGFHGEHIFFSKLCTFLTFSPAKHTHVSICPTCRRYSDIQIVFIEHVLE